MSIEGVPAERVPAHVAIIMDGNGRWAEERGIARTKGHERGEQALFDVVEGALEAGIGWLSVYAFSTENWSRPADEVDFLLNFNRRLLRQRRDELDERRVRIRRVGRRSGVPEEVLAEFDAAEDLTRHHDRMQLLVCFNYGGRAEIEDAVEAGGPSAIARNLYAPDAPDVDLLIRTSGERRLSNFLLWQSAYAELLFTDTLWPDFDRHSLFDALRDYAARDRRYGGLTPPPPA